MHIFKCNGGTAGTTARTTLDRYGGHIGRFLRRYIKSGGDENRLVHARISIWGLGKGEEWKKEGFSVLEKNRGETFAPVIFGQRGGGRLCGSALLFDPAWRLLASSFQTRWLAYTYSSPEFNELHSRDPCSSSLLSHIDVLYGSKTPIFCKKSTNWVQLLRYFVPTPASDFSWPKDFQDR